MHPVQVETFGDLLDRPKTIAGVLKAVVQSFQVIKDKDTLSIIPCKLLSAVCISLRAIETVEPNLPSSRQSSLPFISTHTQGVEYSTHFRCSCIPSTAAFSLDTSVPRLRKLSLCSPSVRDCSSDLSTTSPN